MRAAIVVAGGTGDRFGRPGGKQLAEVAGEPVVAHALRAIGAARCVDQIVLVCHPDRVDAFRAVAASALGGARAVAVAPGRETRRGSVAAGLAALADGVTVVAVHDGARPLLEPAVLDRAVGLLEASDAHGVVVGHLAYDTIKVADVDGHVVATPDRTSLWVAQTPQVFRADALARAHARAVADGFEGTDDASLVERDGGTVLMMEGPRWNVKVTVPEDIAVVEALLAARGRDHDE